MEADYRLVSKATVLDLKLSETNAGYEVPRFHGRIADPLALLRILAGCGARIFAEGIKDRGVYGLEENFRGWWSYFGQRLVHLAGCRR